jgi:hypothetical protein
MAENVVIRAVGPTGPQGPVGPQGATGPQGEPGRDGTDGARGPRGPEGESAYAASGYPGTEAEWLASLKGEKGDKGERGPKGEAGESRVMRFGGGGSSSGSGVPPGGALGEVLTKLSNTSGDADWEAATGLPAGIVGVTVNGYPGIGIKDGGGVVRTAITFSASGGLVCFAYNDTGGLLAETFLSTSQTSWQTLSWDGLGNLLSQSSFGPFGWTLNMNGGSSSFITGVADPSIAPGINAAPGSVYLRENGGGTGTGELWLKTGSETDDIGWSIIAPANIPTADEKAALDGAPTALTAANPVASVADLLSGPAGADGKTILNGAGAPGAIGTLGDFYLDTTASDLYGPLTGGGWGSPTSLIGPAGADGDDGAAGAPGAVWREGTGAPADGTGINGDFYLDDATGNVYERAAGTYGIVANIKGATGAPGAAASVATDTIWDAAGDLAVGSGADTAAKLTKGADGTVLTIDAATHVPKWIAPTSGTTPTAWGKLW